MSRLSCLVGGLVLLVAAGQPVSVHAAASAGTPHTLNLKDADINVLIATVAEITGRTFIVDPRVQGKVTVLSQKAMNREELYALFLEILRVNGYTAVSSGQATRIIPDAAAASDGAAPLNGSPAPAEYVTRIVQLKHLNPAELATVLTPMLPGSARLQSHPASSSLVISDRRENVDRVLEIIRRLDVASQTDVEMVTLGHARASEIVRTLSQLHSPTEGVRVVADERTNAVLVSGERAKRLKVRALIANLDTPLPGSDEMKVVFLRYARAQDLVPILEGVLRGRAPASTGAPADPAAAAAGLPGSGRESVIQAHEETNSLVISAAPATVRLLEEVVRQLDVRRAQVYIEALVAEVSDDTARELGIQWLTGEQGLNSNGVVGGTNFPAPGGNGSIIGAVLDPRAIASGSGLSLGWLSGTDTITGPDGKPLTIYRIGALARALENDGRSNILSQPSTMTLDHEKAVLSVGQEVPFLTGSFATSASTGGQTNVPGGGTQSGIVNPFQTIERKEVGLKLEVTPHINEGDMVVLDLNLESSSLAPSAGTQAVDLITNTRKLSTKVMVRDGGMLVLGGLTSEQLQESIQKVPGLGSIPVLGNLFKSRGTTRQKRTLLVFLKPRIMRDSLAEDLLSSDKYNYLRSEQIEARETRDSLTPARAVPVVPELEDFLRQQKAAKDARGGG
jgi:general secretion pathway protein D